MQRIPRQELWPLKCLHLTGRNELPLGGSVTCIEGDLGQVRSILYRTTDG